jgi:diguanylate cyclase (GGDEF)-like protein
MPGRREVAIILSMSPDRRNRLLLVVAAVSAYGLVFLTMSVFRNSELGIASFFLIPTCMLALAGGPRAAVAGAVLSAGLFVVSRMDNPEVANSTLTIAAVVRSSALLCGGVVVGWFADRNRNLLRELRTAAELDFLTGVGNTRAFEAALTRRGDARRPFALLLADLDCLKEINDRDGHTAGNDALKQLAVTLRQELRPEDDLARVGGDEFAILASVATAEEAGSLARRLEKHALTAGVSATFGWAVFPNDANHHLNLFELADGRLYARKRDRQAPAGDERYLKAVGSD